MKRLVIAITMLLVLLGIAFASPPAYAYTPPGQSSNNATDIILWHGDNVTIEKANVSGTIEIQGWNDTADRFLSFLIIAFILTLVMFKSGTVLTALGVPVAMVYGFTLASSEDIYSPMWVAGVAMAILGLYFLYKIAVEPIIRKMRSGK